MNKWQSVLTSPLTAIIDVLRIIDDNALQIALVVDESNRLLGAVTDGDIRRGILRGISLNMPVQQVMKRSPIVALNYETKEQLYKLMTKHDIKQIPILDNQGSVVGIEFLSHLLPSNTELDNPVILMVGGLGTRLWELSAKAPKSLAQIGNKPILETILDGFIEYGLRYFVFSVNYKAEMIENYFGDGSRWGVEIKYLREKQPLGTAGALSLLPFKPQQPFFVMNGDLLTKVNFRQMLDFHLEHISVATIGVREYRNQIPYGVVQTEGHNFLGIEEKPIAKVFINAGIYILAPEMLSLVPKNCCFNMPDLFTKIRAKNLAVSAFPIREYWLDIGTVESLNRARKEYLEVFDVQE